MFKINHIPSSSLKQILGKITSLVWIPQEADPEVRVPVQNSFFGKHNAGEGIEQGERKGK